MAGLFKRLFGGGEATDDPAGRAPDEEYKGVEVRAAPVKESDGQWRIAGTLTRTADGTTITRRFLRADLLASRDLAVSSTLAKARLIIDQNGDDLWKGDTGRPA
ncbi:HlyU family transcriptional regulator [Oceaniradius stylonematis]|nr:HlyU family transcriptional regulator [Oceaniradius stylonematis]